MIILSQSGCSPHFVVYGGQKETRLLSERHRGDSVMSHPSCTESRQVGALNASSTLWYPSPITTSPQSLSFPLAHRLSDSDVEGTVILKVSQSEHLTSFPNTLLCLFHKSLLIGVHLKNGAFGFDGRENGGKGRSGQPQQSLWSTSLDCSQIYRVSIKQGKRVRTNLGLHWRTSHAIFMYTNQWQPRLAYIFTWSRCCAVHTLKESAAGGNGITAH